jgi:hypothetical protein
MKKQRATKTNLQKILVTLTLTSALQSCDRSSDIDYSSESALACVPRSTASTSAMSAAFDHESTNNNDDLFIDVNQPTTSNLKSEVNESNESTTHHDHDHDMNKQRRVVRIDAAKLRERILTRKSNHLHLPLLNNQSVQIVLNEVKKYSDTNIVATGKTEDDEMSSVTLVINNDVVVASVNEQNKAQHYEIRYNGDGTHAVQEMDLEAEECLAEESGTGAHLMQRMEDNAEMDVAPYANPTIDVLVAYTKNSLAQVGGLDAMKALIQKGVADSNAAYVNSGVSLNLRLVGIMALSQNEGSFSSDLSYLKGTSDGKWDEVHAERRRLGADLVALAAYYSSSTAGIGYVGSSYATGFSITKTTAFKQFSFTHELGHNIGLNHSDGYQNSAGGFRTVMAYGSYTRIPRFSNPALDYSGYATGTASNNSAKILNANGARVAAFSSSVVQGTDPVISDPTTDGKPVECTE